MLVVLDQEGSGFQVIWVDPHLVVTEVLRNFLRNPNYQLAAGGAGLGPGHSDGVTLCSLPEEWASTAQVCPGDVNKHSGGMKVPLHKPHALVVPGKNNPIIFLPEICLFYCV